MGKTVETQTGGDAQYRVSKKKNSGKWDQKREGAKRTPERGNGGRKKKLCG